MIELLQPAPASALQVRFVLPGRPPAARRQPRRRAAGPRSRRLRAALARGSSLVTGLPLLDAPTADRSRSGCLAWRSLLPGYVIRLDTTAGGILVRPTGYRSVR
jgi:hypothetical protein